MVVRFVLQMLHFAVGVVDERALFGQTLYMLQYRSRDRTLKRADLELTANMIDFALREVVMPSRHKSIINAEADQVLYTNTPRRPCNLCDNLCDRMDQGGEVRPAAGGRHDLLGSALRWGLAYGREPGSQVAGCG